MRSTNATKTSFGAMMPQKPSRRRMNTRFTKIGGTGNSKRMSKRSGEDVIIVRSSAGAVLGGGGELNEEERARKLLGISVSDDALAIQQAVNKKKICLLYTSPSPRDGLLSRMPSSA